MSIKLKPTDKKATDYKRIKQLYKTAFPAEERAPFWLLEWKAKKSNIDFWGIYDDQKWVGLFYVVNHKDLSYVFYFAVDSTERGKGYGSAALNAAKEKYVGRRLFLAVEQVDENAGNYKERVRRKDFYLRNGFEEMGKTLKEGTVLYEVLGVGGSVSADEYDKLIESFSGKLLKKFVTMKIIEL